MADYINERGEKIWVGKSLDYFAIGAGGVMVAVGAACIGDIIVDIT